MIVNNTITPVFEVINLSEMKKSEKGLDNWFLVKVHVILRFDLH